MIYYSNPIAYVSGEGPLPIPKHYVDAIQWEGNNLQKVIEFTGQNVSAQHWKWAEYEDIVAKYGLDRKSVV